MRGVLEEAIVKKTRCQYTALIDGKRIPGSLCQVVRYLGEGFYLTESIPDRVSLIVREDDFWIPSPKEGRSKDEYSSKN